MPHLSYKFRIPFSLVFTSLLTTFALGLGISFETYRNIVQDKITEGSRMAYALAPVLIQTLKHDDIWLAYSLLRGPESKLKGQAITDTNTMIVIGENGIVFASNKPKLYRTGTSIQEHTQLFKNLIERIQNQSMTGTVHIKSQDSLAIASGLFSEGAYRGALIIIYPVQDFWNRFNEIISSATWIILLVLMPLTMLGWYWGRYMVAPLTQLSKCMAKMGSNDINALECKVYQGKDEIGELGKQFQQMLVSLKDKQLMEKEILVQERLAAIGRLSASVAHEINNPVGGMLIALDTWRHRPEHERDAEKLLDLIERGLDQIKETVSALLVECRIENRQLEPHDIDDIHTLLFTQPLPPQSHLNWSSHIQQKIDLPASAVRQILMNLTTNAIQAIESGEDVTVRVETSDDKLCIDVSNTGKPIPPEYQTHLFEPFQTLREGGTGLGLWITYQISEQLGGTISVSSDNRLTRFSVKLPIADASKLNESTKHVEA